MTAEPGELLHRAQMLEMGSRGRLEVAVQEIVDALGGMEAPRRRSWLEWLLDDLRAAQEDLCPLCREVLGDGRLHIDHIVPHSRGGGNERSNLQVTHASCNQSKGNDVEPTDMLLLLEDMYMNRADENL